MIFNLRAGEIELRRGTLTIFDRLKMVCVPLFLFTGEFFQGGEGIRFEEGKGVEPKKMAQGEKGND